MLEQFAPCFFFSGECCKSDEIKKYKEEDGMREGGMQKKETEREKNLGWEEGETEKAEYLCPQRRSDDVTPVMGNFR